MTISRDDVLRYAKQRYGTEPEYLWVKYPTYAVLRHSGNRKWYALLGDVVASRVGMDGEAKVDVLNVKCEPDIIEFLLQQDGIVPAYHMNKKNWISVILSSTIEPEKIFGLLDNSYKLTQKR